VNPLLWHWRFGPFAAFGVIGVFVLVACSGGAPVASTPSPEFAQGTAPLSGCPVIRGQQSLGLVAELTVGSNNRFRFAQDEPISMTLTVMNCGDEPVRRFYQDSQRYEFTAKGPDGQEVWRWSHDEVFEQVAGQEIFQPMETVTYTETWDREAGQQVPPGRYEVVGLDVGCTDESLENCNLGPGVFIEITP